MTQDILSTFVTDGISYLVQLPDDNPWGFILADDDQTWDGGFGCGMKAWHAVDATDVPIADRRRLSWLLP
jgi:hypothetical protein